MPISIQAEHQALLKAFYVPRRIVFTSIVAALAAQFYAFAAAAPSSGTAFASNSDRPLPLGDDTAKAVYLQAVTFAAGETAKTQEKAVDLFRQSAGRGYAPAQYDLALVYEEGRGVAQNLAEAARWYGAAAKQGYAPAENNFGRLFALGNGLQKDARQAAYWYGKAAEQGNVEAENNLANSYREGNGVAQDLRRAFELYQSAAKDGYAVAQSNLGLMYANGSGTERDYCLAYAWFALAAANKSASRELLEKVQSKMTAEEIAQGNALEHELQAQVMSNNDRIPQK